jgi:hypothetical protein
MTVRFATEKILQEQAANYREHKALDVRVA